MLAAAAEAAISAMENSEMEDWSSCHVYAGPSRMAGAEVGGGGGGGVAWVAPVEGS